MSAHLGLHAVVELTVDAPDTAASLHAGDVEVLGTPRVVALCEEASIVALADHLLAGQTSVGSRVELSHLAAVALGSTVRASATLERTEGRRLIFAVSVSDTCGLVAVGRVTRVVVDRDHFVDKAR